MGLLGSSLRSALERHAIIQQLAASGNTPGVLETLSQVLREELAKESMGTDPLDIKISAAADRLPNSGKQPLVPHVRELEGEHPCHQDGMEVIVVEEAFGSRAELANLRGCIRELLLP